MRCVLAHPVPNQWRHVDASEIIAPCLHRHLCPPPASQSLRCSTGWSFATCASSSWFLSITHGISRVGQSRVASLVMPMRHIRLCSLHIGQACARHSQVVQRTCHAFRQLLQRSPIAETYGVVTIKANDRIRLDKDGLSYLESKFFGDIDFDYCRQLTDWLVPRQRGEAMRMRMLPVLNHLRICTCLPEVCSHLVQETCAA